MDDSWQDQEDPPQEVGMVSSASVDPTLAITTSIGETHASKQQEQSSIPIIIFLKNSSRLRNGSGMTFLPLIMSKGILSLGKSRRV